MFISVQTSCILVFTKRISTYNRLICSMHAHQTHGYKFHLTKLNNWRPALQSCLISRLSTSNVASLFHANIIIPPRLLELWGIDFRVVLQIPGQSITTGYNVYHYVWHTGPNISEAVNICEKGWLPPSMYRSCSGNPTCGEGPFFSHHHMCIGKRQNFTIDSVYGPHQEGVKMDLDLYSDSETDISQQPDVENGQGNQLASRMT
jgi:JmjC domain, hydroxylase